VADVLPQWAQAAERNIGSGPFVGGGQIHVADLKILMVVRWLSSIPATIFDGYPKLTGVHDAVRDDAGVRVWYAR
jgi:glutathione S-transferase